MSNRLAFPMYAVDSTDTLALWRGGQGLPGGRGPPGLTRLVRLTIRSWR